MICRSSNFTSVLALLFVAFTVVSTDKKCYRSSDCGGKYCCRGHCQPKERCYNPSPPECDKSRDCGDGQSCVNFRCKSRKRPSSRYFCSSNDDCSGPKMKCCSSVCRETCSPTPASPEFSCVASRDCRVDQDCERGKCIKKTPKSRSDTPTTRVGFLSAAIITGAIFLVIMCCCFLKESKSSGGRNATRGRTRPGTRNTRRRETRGSPSSGNFGLTHSHVISINSGTNEFSYPGRADVISDWESQSGPPPYHTLSFSALPPSYDEAVRNGAAVRH